MIDTNDDTSCHGPHFNPGHPEPKSPQDFGEAFSAIMFSFGGASLFPTIQADMRDRTQFPTAAVYSMISKYIREHAHTLLMHEKISSKEIPIFSSLLHLPASLGGELVAAGRQHDGQCDRLSV